MSLKISNKIIFGKDTRPKIVAEISGNHKGKKKLFLDLIKSAAKNGADLIKIQTYEPNDITLNTRNKNFKIKKGIWKNKFLWDLYKEAHTPYEWHYDAFKLAKKLGIVLFSSPFSKKAVDFLENFNVKLYKLSSFEITDLNLIDHIAKTKKPIIISTGMAKIEEIQAAIKIIKKYHNKIIILYCVSGYPTDLKDVNINSLKKLKKKFHNYLIGLSDHTNNIYSSITATALGSCIIEKHFNISKKNKTLDSKFSIFPNQLKDLRTISEKTFESLGREIIGPKKSEKTSLKLRRSLFALKNINRGEKFSNLNIGAFRPKIGLGAENYFKIVGKKSKKFIKKGSPIFKSVIINQNAK